MFRNVVLLAALGTSAGLAFSAGSQTTNIGVTASVASNCLVSTPSTGLAFGVYDPLASSDTVASTTFKVKCSKNAGYTIGLSAGGGAAELARKMALANELAMNYAIYSDSGRTTNWGATAGAATGIGSGLDTENTVTVYGKIPKNQYDVGVGSYTDTVVATISY
jgi:spore coat protein U-like protein